MTRVIRRYKNRKLYDVATSTYVTLTDIYNQVKGGERVRVLDVSFQVPRDITANILLSALLNEEKQNQTSSVDFLVSMIRTKDGNNLTNNPKEE